MALDRFLKKINKEEILDDIKEYESLQTMQGQEAQEFKEQKERYKELFAKYEDDPQLSQLSILQLIGKKAKENKQFEKYHNYSGLQKDLSEFVNLIHMKQVVKEDLENGLIEPTDDVIMERIVRGVEESFLQKFKSFQGSTARQVLYRCVKRVNQRDQETQMGVDMFAEERIKLNNTISAIRSEFTKTLVNLEYSEKENDDLKKVKEAQSKKIRLITTESSELAQKCKDLESEAIQREEELKNAQSIAWGK